MPRLEHVVIDAKMRPKKSIFVKARFAGRLYADKHDHLHFDGAMKLQGNAGRVNDLKSMFSSHSFMVLQSRNFFWIGAGERAARTSVGWGSLQDPTGAKVATMVHGGFAR